MRGTGETHFRWDIMIGTSEAPLGDIMRGTGEAPLGRQHKRYR